MIGFVDPDKTVEKAKKLLDEFGTNFSTCLELNVSQGFHDNMIKVDVIIRLEVPNIEEFNKKLVKILEGK